MTERIRLFVAVLSVTVVLAAVALGQEKKPNILVIWGDDIGYWNISHNSHGMMGYKTPNIDRIAKEGISFTDYYGQQSCTAGRAAFISGSVPLRSGMTKVGLPGAPQGWQKRDVTMATVLKSLGYATGQFGKNHQGDRNEHLPTIHGFDEFFGNLYHLNAEEEPETYYYPKDPEFKKKFGPRGVIRSYADGRILRHERQTQKRWVTKVLSPLAWQIPLIDPERFLVRCLPVDWRFSDRARRAVPSRDRTCTERSRSYP